MDISIQNNQIIIFDTSNFVLRDILECGQMFRFEKTQEGYKIFSKNLKCDLIYDKGHVIINSNCAKYFQNYFDLDTDYDKIKRDLAKYPFLRGAIEFGAGLRLLNQDVEEMIFSFIISQNNNIPRIKLIIQRLSEALGEKIDGGYAFPSVKAFASKSEGFYQGLGLGYRAAYIARTAGMLQDGFSLDISGMSTDNARNYLQRLKGVGPKVADCILLFGYKRTDAFPTDVWINKVYNKIYGDDKTSAVARAKRLSQEFKKLSGYAQQYLYYYARSKHEIDK